MIFNVKQLLIVITKNSNQSDQNVHKTKDKIKGKKNDKQFYTSIINTKKIIPADVSHCYMYECLFQRSDFGS